MSLASTVCLLRCRIECRLPRHSNGFGPLFGAGALSYAEKAVLSHHSNLHVLISGPRGKRGRNVMLLLLAWVVIALNCMRRLCSNDWSLRCVSHGL